MKIPRDCPDWVVSFVTEQKESIYSQLMTAKTPEDLFKCQGRAIAIITLENDIEVRAIDEEQEAREIAGRTMARG